MSQTERPAYSIPHVLRETSKGIQSTSLADELFSRRQIEIVGEVEDTMTYAVCQQLRFLQQEDPNAEITLYFNSPGGSVSSGLAIYDVMQAISCPIRTVCLGMAASMAAVLFVSGDVREILPHATVMIHDPLNYGIGGPALSVKASADHLMRVREIIGDIIARHSGHSLEEVYEVTAKDSYYEAEAAVAWGLADQVIVRL